MVVNFGWNIVPNLVILGTIVACFDTLFRMTDEAWRRVNKVENSKPLDSRCYGDAFLSSTRPNLGVRMGRIYRLYWVVHRHRRRIFMGFSPRKLDV